MRQMAALATAVLVASALGVAAQHRHGPPDHLQHQFDDPARYAEQFDNPARDAWQMPDRVIAALGLQRDSRVADLGAGTGYFSVRLADAVPAGWVYSVDVEPAMVEYVRNRAATDHVPNLQAVLATSDRANLPEPVDVVLVVNTYHHLPSRPEYFRQLQSSLRPGGRVAIIDFRRDAPDGPPVEFRFEPEQIVAEMQRAGYTLDARHEFLPRQHFLVFKPAG